MESKTLCQLSKLPLIFQRDSLKYFFAETLGFSFYNSIRVFPGRKDSSLSHRAVGFYFEIWQTHLFLRLLSFFVLGKLSSVYNPLKNKLGMLAWNLQGCLYIPGLIHNVFFLTEDVNLGLIRYVLHEEKIHEMMDSFQFLVKDSKPNVVSDNVFHVQWSLISFKYTRYKGYWLSFLRSESGKQRRSG